MGALTSKDSSFSYRSWEVKTVKTVDIEHPEFDAINIDVRGKNIIRIRPFIGEKEWVLDTVRFKEKRRSAQKSLLNLIKRKEMIVNMKKYELKKRKVVEKLEFKVLNAFKRGYKEYKDVTFIIGKLVDGKMISVIKSYVKMMGVKLKISSYYSENRVSIMNIEDISKNDFDSSPSEKIRTVINRTSKVEGYSKSKRLEGRKKIYDSSEYRRKLTVASNVYLFLNRENYKLLRKKSIKNMCNLSSVIIYDRGKQSSIQKSLFSTYNAGMKESDMYIRVSTSYSEIRTYIDRDGRQKTTKISTILNISMVNILCGSLCSIMLLDNHRQHTSRE